MNLSEVLCELLDDNRKGMSVPETKPGLRMTSIATGITVVIPNGYDFSQNRNIKLALKMLSVLDKETK